MAGLSPLGSKPSGLGWGDGVLFFQEILLEKNIKLTSNHMESADLTGTQT